MTAGHPQAVITGLDALAAGGNAVDAALAASFCQWVVSAPYCGPGGELVLLHVRPDGAVTVYGGWSRTPLEIDLAVELTARGPRAAAAPGALRGAEAASKRAGRLPWARLFSGALEAARGHAVTSYMAGEYRTVAARGHGAAMQGVFGLDRAPAPGDVIAAPGLFATLQAVARAGANGFYAGAVADQICSAAARDGAWLSGRDLARASADVQDVGGYVVDDLEVFLTPPPSQAAIVADLLAVADRRSAPTSTAFAEAVAPLTERRLTERCTGALTGTAVALAVDDEGGAAVVVHSLAGTQFGCGWVAGETGVAFSNRVGTALTTRPDLPGAQPRPGLAMTHTLSAAHVRTSAGRALTLATPGGDRQVQWLAQAIQAARSGMSAPEIVDAPRWFVCPQGDRFGVPGGIGSPWYAFAEAGVEWSAASICAGYRVRQVGSVGGSLHVTERHEADWTLASDARAGGAAGALRDAT